MNWTPTNTIRVGFSIALALLVGLGWLSFRKRAELVDDYQWVAHTHQVKTDINAMLWSLTRAESTQRGYILTSDQELLDRYHESVADTLHMLDQTQHDTLDNPAQQGNITVLRPLVQTRLAVLQQTLDIAQRHGLAAAQRAVDAGRGEAAQRAILDQAQVMLSEEQRLLERRTAQSNQAATATFVLFTLAAIVQLALLAMVYLLMRRDLLQRRRNELALQAAADELRVASTQLARSNRELQDFASVASHDLQEPLRKIQAFGDRLASRFAAILPPEGKDYLQRMQSAAGRMSTLINDLLSFSRVSSRAQPFIQVDLNQVALEVLIDLEVRLEQLKAKVDVASLPTIEADPTQMRQLLQNLIGNGLKFHKPDESPVVKVFANLLPGGPDNAGVCELRVSDNGIGFDLKYLDRIFTVFQRLHGRNEYEGTGVGLAVCRKIAQRHGGDITADSAPGQGATFIVTLPLRHTTPSASAAVSDGQARSDGQAGNDGQAGGGSAPGTTPPAAGPSRAGISGAGPAGAGPSAGPSPAGQQTGVGATVA